MTLEINRLHPYFFAEVSGEDLTEDNIWVKRPGTGEIRAKDYEKLLKKTILEDVKKDTQLKWSIIEN